MAHYFSERPEVEDSEKNIKAFLRGKDFIFTTSSGVFSKDHVDSGTHLLAESMLISRGEDVLDIGCGIGILGIVAASLGAAVWMSDVNTRACALAKRNVKRNNLSAHAFHGSLYEPVSEKMFDVILSNPPQHAGKDVCFALIEGALGALKGGGNLQLVARHNRGGETLSKKMEEVFGNVSTIAKQGGFRVYLSRKEQ